jgi:hypothetical protein
VIRSLIKNDEDLVVNVNESRGVLMLIECNVVTHSKSMSLLTAIHSHLVSMVWFCNFRSMIMSPPNSLESVTRFHGIRQCPPEKVVPDPLHRNQQLILVMLFITHVSSKKACMKCMGSAFSIVFVSIARPTIERCLSAHPSFLF